MSDNSVGKTPVSDALFQREAELACCRIMEKASGFKADSNFAFASPLVSMRL